METEATPKGKAKTATNLVRKAVFSERSRDVVVAMELAASEANRSLDTWSITPTNVLASEDHYVAEPHLNQFVAMCTYTLSVTTEQAEMIDTYLARTE